MSAVYDSVEIMAIARSTIQRESGVVATLSEQLAASFIGAVEMILNCQGHVLVAGAGTSHAVGARMAHLLSCCGTPALFIHPGDSQHGLSGAVTAHDVLIAISKGGETIEVNHLARIAKARGAQLIGLTEKPDSTLARYCDVVLCVKAPADSDPYGMIATGSSLFNSALGDALCEVLLKVRGYTQDQFGQTHPGGAVGIKLADAGETK
jgi:arabinose-5-phosphate isomerase